MNIKEQSKQEIREVAMRQLSESGRKWAAIRDAAKFRAPAPLFDQPMEISIAMLRGLRMVDETVIVMGDLESEEGTS